MKPKTKALSRNGLSVLWVVAFVVLSLELAMIAVQPADRNESQSAPFYPPGPPLCPERVYSVDQAKSILGQDVRLPKWLADGFQFQGIFIDRGTAWLQLVSGRIRLPTETPLMSRDILSKGYWILYVSEGLPDPASYINCVVELHQGRTKAVMIGGCPGLITCPDDTGNIVAWCMDGRGYRLLTAVGTIPDDLLRFCESVSEP
ncbi:MAG: hypothetical protein QXU73_03400 [Thermoplasmata archaeon]